MKLKKHRSKSRSSRHMNNKKSNKKTKKSVGHRQMQVQVEGKDNMMEMQLDMTDKSLQDFKSSKSISVATTIDDVKSSKIGELYDVKPIHDNIHRICQKKVQGKYLKENPHAIIPKNLSKQLCNCLFEKNSGLRIVDLEKLVKNKMETPASSCITILDQHSSHHSTGSEKIVKSKHKSIRGKSAKSKNI